MIIPPSRWAGLLILIRMGTVGLGLEGHRNYERCIKTLNPSWRLGVFLDGRERTRDLTTSDDRRGWVCGLLRKPHPSTHAWQAYLNDHGDVARFVLSGAVEYRLVSDG